MCLFPSFLVRHLLLLISAIVHKHKVCTGSIGAEYVLMQSSYMGGLLLVDLTKGSTKMLPPSRDWIEYFIGGSGYASRALYEIVDFAAAPLSPNAPLIFMSGPLTGTGAPCSGRGVFCGRSPLTGFWGESNLGGHLGAELKSAGLDGIIIIGRSPSPCVLVVSDGHAEIEPAQAVWGLETADAQAELKKQFGRSEIACIGPAGENIVRFSGIVHRERIAARCGLGATMGHKRLKAIVVWGNRPVELHNPEAFMDLIRTESRRLQNENKTLSDEGTPMYVDRAMLHNDMPVKYFQLPEFDVSNLNSHALSSFITGSTACHACPIACGKRLSVPDRALEGCAAPEFQTIAAFGTGLLLSDIRDVSHLNHMCNQLGLDTISTGSTIAFATYLSSQGVADFDLEWGEIGKIQAAIEAIAHRTGIGVELAEGAQKLGMKYDSEEDTLHVKGMEVPNHDPRAFAGMAVAYAVASRGASHTEADAYAVDMDVEFPELGIVAGDRLSDSKRGVMTARIQDVRAFYDSLILCHFATFSSEVLVKMLEYATGISLSPQQVLEYGSRAVTMKRLFNLRCGLTPEADRLPPRLLQPLKGGLTGGFVPDLARQVHEYYEYRGWDFCSGRPTSDTLESLKLDAFKE
ncbi:hypothetical protein EU538_02990 [Candidatus Thorarchaeota archaeon]|nr:MAG: hypothetical protein EU538_02990 [Candidatus Thorarchaeota archaeon]